MWNVWSDSRLLTGRLHKHHQKPFDMITDGVIFRSVMWKHTQIFLWAPSSCTHTISLTMRLQPFFPTSLMSLQNQNTADPSKERERDVNLSQSKPQFFKGLSPGPLQKSKKNEINNEIFPSLIYITVSLTALYISIPVMATISQYFSLIPTFSPCFFFI